MMEHIARKYPEHAWELVSRRPGRSVFRLVRHGAAEYYVKLYGAPRLKDRLLGLLRPKILHEAFMLWQLGVSGFPVPGIREHLSLSKAGALVTHAIAPCRGLNAEDPARQAQVMLGLGLDLINHGYAFTDMRADNIVLDGAGKPFLVDAYGIRPCRRITLENAASVFAQVARQCSLGVRDLDPYLARLDAVSDLGKLRERIRVLRMKGCGETGRGA
jgi:hypothetical protein